MILDGGVLQNNSATTFTRGLGASGSAFQWTANGGGFSAGTSAVVGECRQRRGPYLGTSVGSQIVGTLKFSSSTAANVTTFRNAVNLSGANRTIQVDDNAASAADWAVMSGNITNNSGTAGIDKTGAGKLILGGTNSYNGKTIVDAGTLTYSTSAAMTSGPYTVNGGTLDIGAFSKSIGAFQLTGGTVSGTGTLTSNIAYDIQGGTVNAKLGGTSIALNKTGAGTAVLNGANTYTGRTTVTSGTLELGLAAQNALLNLGGADIQSGNVIFDYAGGSDPAATIRSLLTANYDGGLWDVGKFTDSTAASSGLTLGCLDNPAMQKVTVMATYPGDFNLDGVVDDLDLNIWKANAGIGTLGSWATPTMTAVSTGSIWIYGRRTSVYRSLAARHRRRSSGAWHAGSVGRRPAWPARLPRGGSGGSKELSHHSTL